MNCHHSCHRLKIRHYVQLREWITYHQVNQVISGSAVEFNIPAQSAAYLVLKRIVLNRKLQVINGDGSIVDENEVMTLINLPIVTIQPSP